MKYQLKLVDQNLPGLTRELAIACWQWVDVLLPERPGNRLYRALYRALRGVLQARVQSFRYCGAAWSCEHCLHPTELGLAEWKEQNPPASERVRIYLLEPETSPTAFVTELLGKALRATAETLPHRHLKGMARLMKAQISKVLRGRILRSDVCGSAQLCSSNEAYDPWDATNPINTIGNAL